MPDSFFARACRRLISALPLSPMSRAPFVPARLGSPKASAPQALSSLRANSPFSAQDELDLALCQAARDGREPELDALLRQGARPKALQSQALRWAAEMGREACVRRLLPLSNAKAAQCRALERAALNGHAGCVALLIPVSSPKANGSAALSAAASRGHARCVELLLPLSNPDALNGKILIEAAGVERPDCLRALLRPQTPKTHIGAALCRAASSGRAESFALLLAALGRALPPREALDLTLFTWAPGRSECLALFLQARAASIAEARAARQLALSRGALDSAQTLLCFIERSELGQALPAAADAPRASSPRL